MADSGSGAANDGFAQFMHGNAQRLGRVAYLLTGDVSRAEERTGTWTCGSTTETAQWAGRRPRRCDQWRCGTASQVAAPPQRSATRASGLRVTSNGNVAFQVVPGLTVAMIPYCASATSA